MMHLPHDEENEDRSDHKQDNRFKRKYRLFLAHSCSCIRHSKRRATSPSTPQGFQKVASGKRGFHACTNALWCVSMT